jgi:hypothetical protein
MRIVIRLFGLITVQALKVFFNQDMEDFRLTVIDSGFHAHLLAFCPALSFISRYQHDDSVFVEIRGKLGASVTFFQDILQLSTGSELNGTGYPAILRKGLYL